MKRELGETIMELQDAKVKLSQASKGDQQGVGDTPAGHICTNHDPPSAEEDGQSRRHTLGFEPSF